MSDPKPDDGGNESSMQEVERQDEYDGERLEKVAEDLREMANSLSRQSAIDDEIPDTLHRLSSEIYGSFPYVLEVNTDVE